MTGLFEGMRRARILIPDNTPLSLLAMIGPSALDWLFVPGAEVWITDMVLEEAMREPSPDADQRDRHRADLSAWLGRNRRRIHVQPTEEGEEYRKAMQNWAGAGSPPATRPSWRARGERSILQVLDAVERLVADGEAVLAIVDDRKVRAAIRALADVDIDILATESFLTLLAEEYDLEEAATAWMAIRIASGETAPDAPEEDPVHIHRVQ